MNSEVGGKRDGSLLTTLNEHGPVGRTPHSCGANLSEVVTEHKHAMSMPPRLAGDGAQLPEEGLPLQKVDGLTTPPLARSDWSPIGLVEQKAGDLLKTVPERMPGLAIRARTRGRMSGQGPSPRILRRGRGAPEPPPFSLLANLTDCVN